MTTRKPYFIESYNLEKEIIYKNLFSLILSPSYLKFLRDFPGMEFQEAVSVKFDENDYPIFKFLSFISLVQILSDDDLMEHLDFVAILKKEKVLPFCSCLLSNYYFFIGAERQNLDKIFLYDVDAALLSEVAESIEIFFESGVNYNFQMT